MPLARVPGPRCDASVGHANGRRGRSVFAAHPAPSVPPSPASVALTAGWMSNQEVPMAKQPRPLRPRRFPFQRILAGAACLVLAAAVAPGQTRGAARPPLPADLEKVHAALAKYEDVVVAVHDGYHSTVGCVQYPEGGMGIHFVNRALIGPVPDPMRPQILLYVPVGDKLALIGAEWFIPLATGVKERPHLFGQAFDGPMEGHTPLQPAALHHYDLHVWLFKHNPLGMFKRANPEVKCPTIGYTVHHQ